MLLSSRAQSEQRVRNWLVRCSLAGVAAQDTVGVLTYARAHVSHLNALPNLGSRVLDGCVSVVRRCIKHTCVHAIHIRVMHCKKRCTMLLHMQFARVGHATLHYTIDICIYVALTNKMLDSVALDFEMMLSP